MIDQVQETVVNPDITTDQNEQLDNSDAVATNGISKTKKEVGEPCESGPAPSSTRTAFVHDWLPVIGGAERVLEQMLTVFPKSDVFTLVDDVSDSEAEFLPDTTIHTSFIQKLPFGRTKYRYYLPLAPIAVEQFDLRDFELVVSSNYAVAKGILTSADQLHVSYTHSPIRYAWDLYFDYMEDRSLRRWPKRFLARVALHYVRVYDCISAQRVDRFIANSKHVARRIWKTYRRPSKVVYPPVNTSHFSLYDRKEDFYLTLSRLVPYKRTDLIVKAFNELPGKELIVIGEGPQHDYLESIAGPNVTILGYQPDEAVQYYMQRARAFLFAAEEDFGIVPLEAQACGTPVIAYGRGGALETVISEKTGIHFEKQTPDSVIAAVREFDRQSASFEAGAIREHAMKFSVSRFQQEFLSTVEEFQYSFERFGPSLSGEVCA